MKSFHSSQVTNGTDRGTGCPSSSMSSSAASSSNSSLRQNSLSGGVNASPFMVDLNLSTESLPQSSFPTEHRADLGAAVAATPRPEARISAWARVKRWNARLEDSWIGDLIGAICLFVIGYAATIFLWVLS